LPGKNNTAQPGIELSALYLLHISNWYETKSFTASAYIRKSIMRRPEKSHRPATATTPKSREMKSSGPLKWKSIFFLSCSVAILSPPKLVQENFL
jgi:hypothetical protein